MRLWQIAACLLAFAAGFAGSYSNLSRAGVYSGVGGFAFVAGTTVLAGPAGVIGLWMASHPEGRGPGLTSAGIAFGLVIGAWVAVAVYVVRSI